MVEVNINELRSTADDVFATPNDLENLTEIINENKLVNPLNMLVLMKIYDQYDNI